MSAAAVEVLVGGASEAVSLAFMSSADTSTGWLSAAAAPSTWPSQTREDPFRRSQRTILGLAHRFNARGPRKMHGSNSTSSTSLSSPAAAWMDGLSFCRPFASDEGDCVLRKSERETAGLLPFRHRSVMQTALASVVREKGTDTSAAEWERKSSTTRALGRSIFPG